MRTVASLLTKPPPPRRREFPLFSNLGVNRNAKEQRERVEKLEASSNRKTNSSSVDTELYVLKEDVSPGNFGPVEACAKQLIESLLHVEEAENGLELTTAKPFNWIEPRNDFIIVKQLAEMMTEVYSKVSGEPIIEVPLIDVSSKEFNVEAYDDSDKHIPDMTITNKQLVSDLVRKISQESTLTYQHRTYAEAIKEAVATFNMGNPQSEVAVKQLAEMTTKENPAWANGQIFNLRNPDNEITVKQLAEMMAEVLSALLQVSSKVSWEPTFEVQTVDVSSKEIYGKGYDDSDKRIPDMITSNKQIDWDPNTSLEPPLTCQHRSYAEAIKKAVAILNVGNPNNEVIVKQLAEMMTEVYSKASVEPTIEVPISDVISKELCGRGYDDSDKRIPDMTVVSKQCDWDPKISLASTMTYQHRTYAEAIKKAIP